MIKLRAFAAGLLLAALPIAPAPAQDELNIINNPSEPEVAGAQARLRDDPAVQGGKALRIRIRKGTNSWDVSVNSVIDKPVMAGDSLMLAFWARLERGQDGASSTTLPYAGVQLRAAPYSALLSSAVEIGPEWKLVEIRGKVDSDHAAGALNATVHLAGAEQTVDLGPLFVVNLGQ